MAKIKIWSDLYGNIKQFARERSRISEPIGTQVVKNAKWDKEDGYFSPRDCYNSYFYLSEDTSINLIDKFVMHGRDTTRFLDGGQPIMVAVYAWATDINLVNHANGCGVSETHC